MLIEVDSNTYKSFFPSDPNPFISDSFIELNSHKTEKVIRLVEDSDKPGMGLVAGIRDGIIQSPFSAPFGGFHFRKDVMYSSEIDNYVSLLKDYIASNGLLGIEITLPPDIYHLTFNTKLVSSLIRNGYHATLPEITNWIDLVQFQGEFSQRNSREGYRQAVRNELCFEKVSDLAEKQEAYNLIYDNRKRLGRPIYMKFNDITDTSSLWPTDFFKVCDANHAMVASAIIYRNHPTICFALFWGDSETGRPLKAMDFLTLKLWTFYKNQGYKYFDLGISTEKGTPNEGLLRFKESHNGVSSLRSGFSWNVGN